MGATVRNVVNQRQLQFIISSPLGPVAKDLLKRGARVVTRARRNLGGNTGTGPRRVDTGLLRNSVLAQLQVRPNGLAVRVGTGIYYARYVHDGTGIYGPKHKVIKPKNGKFLMFRSNTYGAKRGKYRGFVFARSVKGMKPNPFLKNALPYAGKPG